MREKGEFKFRNARWRASSHRFQSTVGASAFARVGWKPLRDLSSSMTSSGCHFHRIILDVLSVNHK